MKLKIDMHIHTLKSFDSNNTIDKIAQKLRENKLDGAAITDHNYFYYPEYEKIVKKYNDLIWIPAMEFDFKGIHLLCYFIKEKVNKTDNIYNIIEKLHNQGAIISLAHPYKRKLFYENKLLKMIDAIEAYNARGDTLNNNVNKLAYGLSEELDSPMTAGSDAHFYEEVGNAYTIFDVKERTIEELKKCIYNKNTKIQGANSSLKYESLSAFIAFMKRKKIRYFNNALSLYLIFISKKIKQIFERMIKNEPTDD